MLKELKIELTNECSRNCKHCSSNATDDVCNRQTLDYFEVHKIIVNAYNMGVKKIIFTGGEPLMYPYLSKLILLVKYLEMESVLYTYGYRTDENIQKYKYLIICGLNKIVYSLSNDLSDKDTVSKYSLSDFFDKVIGKYNCKLGFHYVVSKDTIPNLDKNINQILKKFDKKSYFDKISLLRYVPHGRGTNDMDLDYNDLLLIKDIYFKYVDKNRIKLGSPFNILGITNTPCTIADETMIIGFDGFAYPCDSIKYFSDLGVSGNISDNTLYELYNSEYFNLIRSMKDNISCSSCSDYSICHGGCIGQKILNSYDNAIEKEKILTRCNSSVDPKCMRKI